MFQLSAFIFDLDRTIIDTSALKDLRDARKWSEIQSNLGTIDIYPEIQELIDKLVKHSIPWAVVTSSPESYCHAVLQHLDLSPNATICYNDRYRSDPEPLLQAAKKLKVGPNNIIVINDCKDDEAAAIAAGMYPITFTIPLLRELHHTLQNTVTYSDFTLLYFGLTSSSTFSELENTVGYSCSRPLHTIGSKQLSHSQMVIQEVGSRGSDAANRFVCFPHIGLLFDGKYFDGLDLLLTAGWKKTDVRDEKYTKQFIKAKDGNAEAIKYVCDLLRYISSSIHCTNPIKLYVVPLIPSGSTTSSPSDLPYKLAKVVSEATGGIFSPGVLRKEKHMKRSGEKNMTRAQRKKIVHDTYRADGIPEQRDEYGLLIPSKYRKVIILVDDYVTIGHTMAEASRAIRTVNIDSIDAIIGIAIAKTGKVRYQPKQMCNAHLDRLDVRRTYLKQQGKAEKFSLAAGEATSITPAPPPNPKASD